MNITMEKNLLDYYKDGNKYFNEFKNIDYISSNNKQFYNIVDKTIKNNMATHKEMSFYNYVFFNDINRLQYGWKIHICTDINNSIEILQIASNIT